MNVNKKLCGILYYYVCRASLAATRPVKALWPAALTDMCVCAYNRHLILVVGIGVNTDSTCLAPLFRLSNVSGGHLNKGVIGIGFGRRSLSRRCVASSDRLHDRASDGHRPRGRIGDVTLR